MARRFTDSGRRFLILAGYSVAMGVFEAIVVIYLRRIYYPQGFEFPLRQFSSKMLSIELLREFSTILMIIAVAFLSARDGLKRFAWFLYIFAVWDISYYISLKLLIGWPPSLLTWDILFLIPVTWAGPVLAPAICSITMLLITFSVIYLKDRGYSIRMAGFHWVLIISGGLVIFWSFIKDYFLIITRGGFLGDFWNLAENIRFNQTVSNYTPSTYNWFLFAIGEILILAWLFLLFKRASRTNTL
ncbi:hypothetical protein J7M07_00505 [bacterium]|nr:hypothetical protein [bacterium]